MAEVKYPLDMLKLGVQGRVVAAFVVDKEGRITMAEILKSPHPQFSEEVMHALERAPRWTPGSQDGEVDPGGVHAAGRFQDSAGNAVLDRLPRPEPRFLPLVLMPFPACSRGAFGAIPGRFRSGSGHLFINGRTLHCE